MNANKNHAQGRNVSSELYKVFSVEDNKDGKKKTAEEKKIDKEEERKVRRYTNPVIARQRAHRILRSRSSRCD